MPATTNSIAALTAGALERYFAAMNESQRRAVFLGNGPLLILAGAGSGKTTVLIRRAEYLILFGDAFHTPRAALPSGEDIALLERYCAGKEELEPARLGAMIGHHQARPWNILAITFTNKAAGELRARLEARLGEETGRDVTASTFHALCVRILRRDGEAVGISRGFTIYDADDAARVVKNCVKQAGLDDKLFPAKAVLSELGRARDCLIDPKEYAGQAEDENNYRKKSIARVYEAYRATLRASNALDFDDLICEAVRLLRQHPAILDKYRARWRYIMVDEYQDTNHAQYVLVSLLAGGHGNLCVVGDDDQSIYKFRGATIENILRFEEQFPGAAVVRLEQNYRSTGHILEAANRVIANNTERKGKTLWTSAGDGQKVAVHRVADEEAESRFIVAEILGHVQAGGRFGDHAVLYRMNAQSGTVEQALARSAIPYRIVGGVRFYERKEIKDMLAYLTVLVSPADNLRLSRIVNEPKRGIGATTLAAAQEIAAGMGVPLLEVLRDCEQFEALAKKKVVLEPFIRLIEDLTALAGEAPPDAVLDAILERTGYRLMLEGQGLEGAGRMENILELKSNLIRYMQEDPDGDLGGFLEEIALYTDLDSLDASADSVVLMTIHAAKGLEFRHVFLAGMDEGIFPGRNAMNFPAEIEEERRLAYVAITRAKETLTALSAMRRLLFGQTFYGQPSRFLREMPPDNADTTDHTAPRGPAPERPPLRPTARKLPQASTSIGISGAGATRAAKAGDASYAAGDRVAHGVFGEGTVLSVKPMGGDLLLEIDFGASTRKIMANYAKLTKSGQDSRPV